MDTNMLVFFGQLKILAMIRRAIAVMCKGIFMSCRSQENGHPIIVIILADDMGFGDLHFCNSTSEFQTHNLDKLSEKGIIFTDARTKPVGRPFQQPYQHYDLEKDLAESNNLIEKENAVAEKLEATYFDILGYNELITLQRNAGNGAEEFFR